ncbi:unnamed protein product [Ranitomeya imitator]|uniref:Uncharacterized protein n=1 Tax=Ranitomeya imitator TaxID=111125 RepID=A0ABN9MCR0_9NEOB|nr:unnamed protein product [Ranitomeya imitator]
MPQHVPGSISSGCYVVSHSHPQSGLQNTISPDTSNPTDVNHSNQGPGPFSSGLRIIGQRLAIIGDDISEVTGKGFENKMAHVIRQSIRVVGNCQNFALSLLRSVKNITSRVDHGVTQTPGRGALVSTRDPVTVNPNLLLVAALVAVFGIIIKLGLDD